MGRPADGLQDLGDEAAKQVLTAWPNPSPRYFNYYFSMTFELFLGYLTPEATPLQRHMVQLCKHTHTHTPAHMHAAHKVQIRDAQQLRFYTWV